MTDQYQLPKDIDIISYRPVLEKSEKINLQMDSTYFSDSEEDAIVEHTAAVQQITQNPVSSTIGTLDRLSQDVTAMLESLEIQLGSVKGGDITFGDFKQALENGDSEITDDYMEHHRNDIDGDTRVEVYENLAILKGEVSEIRQLSAKVIYGDTKITYEDAAAVDAIKNEKLVEYEREGMHKKINYAALVLDAQINKVLSGQASVLQDYSSQLFSMTHKQEPSIATTERTDPLELTVKGFFHEYAHKNREDRKKLLSVTNRGLVNESLVNAFNQRSSLLSMINSKQTLLSIANEYADTINQSIAGATHKIYDHIVDLNKTVLMSAMYRDDYLSTLKRKQDLRNVNKQLKR